MEDFIRNIVLGASAGGIYALVAVCYVIIFKATRVFPFSQAGMITIGAYVMWHCLFVWNLPVWLGVIVTLAIAFTVGLIIERIWMRPLIGQPVLAPIIVTLAIMLLLRGVSLLIWHGQIRGYGEAFLPRGTWQLGFVTLPQIQVYGFIICVLIIVLLILFYQFTQTGLAMRVVHEDHLVAQNLGINVRRIFQYSWILSCTVAVVAGMLLGNIQGVGVDLEHNGIIGIVCVLFGGLESFAGAIIAGLTIGIFQVFAITYLGPIMPGEITMMAPMVVMLLILMFKPYGLFGLEKIERL